MDRKSKSDSVSHVSDVRPEFVLLGLLNRRPLHGYDLYQELQASLGWVWRMSQSQMYTILRRMETQGLISGAQPQAEGARRTLTLTALGSEKFGVWLREPSDCASRVLRSEFISRLYFADAEGPDLATKVAREQAERIERQLANHQKILQQDENQSAYNRLGLLFRVYQLESELAWIRKEVLPLTRGP
jgi:PadR family transcriptional regulator, regulatory protein AphA